MNPIILTQSTDMEVEGLKMVDHHHHHHDTNPYPIDYSMVVIHDTKDCAVFPPINHENLSNQDTPQSPSPSPPSSSSSSSCLTSDSDTCGGKVATSSFDPHVRKGGDFTGWMSFGLQFLRSKVSSFRNGGAFRSIRWLPAAAVVFSCWALVMMAKKKRRRTSTPNETLLMNIIEEKDGVRLIPTFRVFVHFNF